MRRLVSPLKISAYFMACPVRSENSLSGVKIDLSRIFDDFLLFDLTDLDRLTFNFFMKCWPFSLNFSLIVLANLDGFRSA
jgi:hypothetical protein